MRTRAYRQVILMFMLFGALLYLEAPVYGADNKTMEDQTMNRNDVARENMQKWLLGENGDIAATDPELAAIHDNLVYGQILNHGTLDDRHRALIILASLTAAQNFEALPKYALAALKLGIPASDLREALYQCAPYVGFPRVEAALSRLNPLFKNENIKLPLPDQGTVTENSRFQDGLAVQKRIFGADNIGNMQKNAPKGQADIVTDYLSAFCFGDFYTRKCLDLKTREIITFSAIVSLGGCDPQARAHARGNISVGNSKQNLVDALAVMLPFIGFPRTLNGLAAVNEAVPE